MSVKRKKFEIGDKMDRSRDLGRKRADVIIKKFLEIIKTTKFEEADSKAIFYIMDLIGKKRMTKGVWLSLTIDLISILQLAMMNKDDDKESMFSVMTKSLSSN